MKNIYLQINHLHLSGVPLVLATVVRTNGSTPQKPGSSGLFGDKGLIEGTVGGGVVEGRIQRLSSEALKTKKSGLFHFDLANDISNKVEAICGGQISVLVDADMANSASVFLQLEKSLAERIPGVLITEVTELKGNEVLIKRYWMDARSGPLLTVGVSPQITDAVLNLISEKNPSAFSEMRSAYSGEKSSLYFLQPFFPPARLIIAGAGHIGRALAHIASLLKFEVTVVDDRQEFANHENIPEADHIIVKEIGEAMHELARGEGTYVVIVTRGHKDDASALKPCLGRDINYIGMIGSRNKVASMRQDFLDSGWATPEQWDKIHAPVGLQIRSQTVEEIAVSIAAELILIRNRKQK